MAQSTPASYDPAEEPSVEKTETQSASQKAAAQPVSRVPQNVVSPTTAGASYPGQTLGIVALVFSVFMQLPALAMGIIAWVWSHKAGVRNVPAIISVAVSGSLLIIGTIFFALWVALMGSLFGGFDRHQPPVMVGGPVQVLPGDIGMMGDDEFEQHMHDMLKDLEEGNSGVMPAPGPGMMAN